MLVIGAAVGGETAAALFFGAKRVDAIDLVGSMIDAAKTRYAEYSGGVYNDPRVRALVGEGRSFLRASPQQYDIIQMFSNHTSSAIASGTMAAGTAYLQTVEAYMEYFTRLTADGALQINHHVYPRMLTTAAQAWHRLGRKEFWRHVVVLEAWNADTLPTVIVKMQPWSQDELDDLMGYADREPNPAARRPAPHHLSNHIFADKTYSASLTSNRDTIEGLALLLGTDGRKGLPFDVIVTLADGSGDVMRSARIAGDTIRDRRQAIVEFEPLAAGKDREFQVTIAAPGATRETGVSVWLDVEDQPLVTPQPPPRAPSYLLVFNPLDPDANLVPRALLQTPFPADAAAALPWDITPVTDDSPYFHMTRKQNKRVAPGVINVLDRNTAHLLNVGLQRWVPKDWLHLAVIAVVSLGFAVLFIAVPFLVTGWRQTRWEGMSYDIIYFSCLGLGFILIEICFIQLFKKLIGFPTHTFTTVVFSMLISAGIGSGASKRLLSGHRSGWMSVFALILLYGILCIVMLEDIFYAALGLPLYGRIGVAFLLIAPLGFLLGMPFPIGIEELSRRANVAIPWAWALNGFFTVFGGYLAMLLSIAYGFDFVMLVSLAIYAVAWLSHRQLRALGALAPRRLAASA